MNNIFKSIINKYKNSLKFKISLIVFIVIYILIILGCTIKVNKEVITPGVLNNPSYFLTVGSEELGEVTYDKGNINTIGVYVTYQPTLFQYLLSQNDKFDISDYDISSDLSPKDQYNRSKNLKDISITNALITAYEKAKLIDSSININYSFQGLLVTANLPSSYSDELKIGDIITKVIVSNVTYELSNCSDGKYQNYFVSLIKDSYYSKEEFTLVCLRGEEELNIPFMWKENGSLGLELHPNYQIISTTPSYHIDQDTVYNSIGSSGGMMLTLTIYNSLIEKDVTCGMMICGTGTVDNLGNIGAIGGIRQKITTSQLYKADIFFCPYSSDTSTSEYQNYMDALSEYQKIKNPTFELVKITCFDDVLAALERYGS